MDIYGFVLLVARIVLGLVFLLPGVQAHLVHRAQTVEIARVNGVPLPRLFVPLAGVCLIAGGLMVTTGAWVDLGAILLALFSVSAALLMHAFWREQDPAAAQNQLAHFMKNLGLAAGAIAVASAYLLLPSDASFSLTAPLLGRSG